MANKTVHFQEAVAILTAEYTEGVSYKYGDISSTLLGAFPDINKNQISGLITRLVNTGYFEKYKEPGTRYDYIFKKNVQQNKGKIKSVINENKSLQEIVQGQINDLAENLNELKTSITTPDEFLWLQTKIDNLLQLSKD